MADNITVPGAGEVLAYNDIAGVKHLRTKIQHGADGAAEDVSDANPLPIYFVSPPDVVVVAYAAPATATVAQVASSASAVTLQAANADRRGLRVQNDSTAVLYLKYGAGASLTSYTKKLVAGEYWEMPPNDYSGIVSGIWATTNGFAYVTET